MTARSRVRRRALAALAQEFGFERGDDPLATVRRTMSEIYARFEYSPSATRVDSPIDEALEARRGVCQDFAHIMIALVRRLGVPCRYVSGYLFQHADRKVRSTDGATHAWVEALLPGLGWVGFDPTNNMIAGDRHIRVAIGRDYADVPPTRGVFKGVERRAERTGRRRRHRHRQCDAVGRGARIRAVDVAGSAGCANPRRRQPAAVRRICHSVCSSATDGRAAPAFLP